MFTESLLLYQKYVYWKNIFKPKVCLSKEYFYTKNILTGSSLLYQKYIHRKRTFILKVCLPKADIYTKNMLVQKVWLPKAYIYTKNMFTVYRYFSSVYKIILNQKYVFFVYKCLSDLCVLVNPKSMCLLYISVYWTYMKIYFY